jgi:hypothetical protein
MRAILEQAGQPEQVLRQHGDRVAELPIGSRVARVPLVALRDDVHHHQAALGDGDLEVGGLSDDRGVDRADALHRFLHRRVPGFLAVPQDHEQPARIHPSALFQIARGPEHRGDRGLGVAGAATVKPGALDHRRERVPGPPGSRGHGVQV